MAKGDDLCAICRKNIRYGKSAACKKCMKALQKEQIGLKPNQDICSLCGNTIPDDSNICKKCDKKLSYTIRARKKSNTDKVFDLLKDVGTYVTVDEIVAKTKLSDTTVRSILVTGLRHKVRRTGDSYKLKAKYLKDDVNQTVCDILSGAVVTEQIDRML